MVNFSFENLKHDFKESKELQSKVKRHIDLFKSANETTREVAGVEAIYQVGYLNYENEVLKETVIDCESEIDKLENQNAYLEQQNIEYKKMHGSLNETQLQAMRKGFESATKNLSDNTNRLMLRLEKSRQKVKEQTKQIK